MVLSGLAGGMIAGNHWARATGSDRAVTLGAGVKRNLLSGRLELGADAILVGGETLRADAPRLDVRLPGLEARSPDVIAAGNIGCLTQLGDGALPAVHTVELLDWMAGGPEPAAVARARAAA